MTAVIPFLFDNVALVRVVDRGNAPWFVGKDVATALGYADPPKAITAHCKRAIGLTDKVGETPTLGLHPQTKLIPESDVFRLILKSQLPAAQRFEVWVMEDLLPAMRRGGLANSANPEPRHQTEALEGLKLRAVSECRKVFGPRAAGQLWFALSLPTVAAMALDPAQPDLLTGGGA